MWLKDEDGMMNSVDLDQTVLPGIVPSGSAQCLLSPILVLEKINDYI